MNEVTQSLWLSQAHVHERMAQPDPEHRDERTKSHANITNTGPGSQDAGGSYKCVILNEKWAACRTEPHHDDTELLITHKPPTAKSSGRRRSRRTLKSSCRCTLGLLAPGPGVCRCTVSNDTKGSRSVSPNFMFLNHKLQRAQLCVREKTTYCTSKPLRGKHLLFLHRVQLNRSLNTTSEPADLLLHILCFH